MDRGKRKKHRVQRTERVSLGQRAIRATRMRFSYSNHRYYEDLTGTNSLTPFLKYFNQFDLFHWWLSFELEGGYSLAQNDVQHQAMTKPFKTSMPVTYLPYLILQYYYATEYRRYLPELSPRRRRRRRTH